MTAKLRIALVAALLAIPVTAYAAKEFSSCGCGEKCACGEKCSCAH